MRDLSDVMKEVSKVASPTEFKVLEELCRTLMNDTKQRLVPHASAAYGGMHPCGCIGVNPTFAHFLIQAHRQGFDDGIQFFINHEKGHRAHGEFGGRFTAEGLFAAKYFDTSYEDIRNFVSHVKSEHSEGEFDYVAVKVNALYDLLGMQDPAVEREADMYALEMAEKPVEAISSLMAILVITSCERQTALCQEIRGCGLHITDVFIAQYFDSHDLRSAFSNAELIEVCQKASAKFNALGGNYALDLLRY